MQLSVNTFSEKKLFSLSPNITNAGGGFWINPSA
jgi:hypothetical protein